MCLGETVVEVNHDKWHRSSQLNNGLDDGSSSFRWFPFVSVNHNTIRPQDEKHLATLHQQGKIYSKHCSVLFPLWHWRPISRQERSLIKHQKWTKKHFPNKTFFESLSRIWLILGQVIPWQSNSGSWPDAKNPLVMVSPSSLLRLFSSSADVENKTKSWWWLFSFYNKWGYQNWETHLSIADIS